LESYKNIVYKATWVNDYIFPGIYKFQEIAVRKVSGNIPDLL